MRINKHTRLTPRVVWCNACPFGTCQRCVKLYKHNRKLYLSNRREERAYDALKKAQAMQDKAQAVYQTLCAANQALFEQVVPS